MAILLVYRNLIRRRRIHRKSPYTAEMVRIVAIIYSPIPYCDDEIIPDEAAFGWHRQLGFAIAIAHDHRHDVFTFVALPEANLCRAGCCVATFYIQSEPDLPLRWHGTEVRAVQDVMGIVIKVYIHDKPLFSKAPIGAHRQGLSYV